MFKSKLGQAALEELKEDEVPAAAEGEGTDSTAAAGGEEGAAAAGADAGAADAGADTAAADTGAAAAAGGEEGADAGAAGADAGADAGAAGADAGADGATATGADTGADAGADAGTDTGADAGADAAAAGEDPAAASAAAAAVGEADATGDVSDVVGEAGDADAEIVEEEMAAVDVIDDKAAEVDEDVEKLNVATEALEGCVGILDAAIQRGGLDVFGSSLLRNNVNTVTDMLKVKAMTLPALEDLETPTAKIDGAATAKEGLVGFIKRMLAALKQAFVRFGQWIAETYKRLTNAFVAVEKRAETLKQKVQAATMVEGSISNKGLASKLRYGGAVAKDILEAIETMGKHVSFMNDPKSYKGYIEALELCEELAKNPEKAEELRGKISAVLDQWAKEMEKNASNTSGQVRASLADSKVMSHMAGAVSTFAVPLFDNQLLQVTIPNTAEGVRALSSLVGEGTATDGGDSVTALNQAEAVKICDAVIRIAKEVRESIEGNRGGVKELNAEIKKREDTIAAMVATLINKIADDAESGATVRKGMLFINNYLLSAPKLPVHAMNKVLPRNLSIALDAVAASIGGKAEVAAAPAGTPAIAA